MNIDARAVSSPRPTMTPASPRLCLESPPVNAQNVLNREWRTDVDVFRHLARAMRHAGHATDENELHLFIRQALQDIEGRTQSVPGPPRGARGPVPAPDRGARSAHAA